MLQLNISLVLITWPKKKKKRGRIESVFENVLVCEKSALLHVVFL